jgi:hypothetical protein
MPAKCYPPPNLLIMVGGRYAWVPLPFAIPQDEFEATTVWLTHRGRAEAVRELGKVYHLDDNHLVPPGLNAKRPSLLQRLLGSARRPPSRELIGAYTLRSREDDLPELAPRCLAGA